MCSLYYTTHCINLTLAPLSLSNCPDPAPHALRPQVGKGREEPHDAVHDAHHSRNKGLGYSHIVYCNFRGKIIRVSVADKPRVDL